MITCPYCGKDAALVDSKILYASGKSYGPAWACLPCGAWVGCHKGTIDPLGGLANEELRKARMAAHAAFDPTWKRYPRGGLGGKYQSSGHCRREMYRWLGQEMGFGPNIATHIAQMDVVQCRQVVAICEKKDKRK